MNESYRKLKAILEKRLKEDKRLTAIYDKIKAGKADFSLTADYSEIVSGIISQVIMENVGNIGNPLGLEFVCRALLNDHYERINGVLGQVQAMVDEKLGIHLKPQKAPFPQQRVDKVCHSLSDPTVPIETIIRRAGAPVENVAKSFHDDYIEKNAKFRNDAGVKCYLVRTTNGKCCSWCSKIAGRYDYATAPEDIFRRHDNCACQTIYECGNQRQDVWSKKSWNEKNIKDTEYKPKKLSPQEADAIEKKNLKYKGIDKSDESGILKTRGLSAKIGGEGAVDLHDEPVLLKKIDFLDKEAVDREIALFEETAVYSDIETALVITREGEIYKCFGVSDAVFPDYDLGDKIIGSIISHNHPINETVYSFSNNDIDLFCNYKLEILRGCDEKYTYQLDHDSNSIDDVVNDWAIFENYQHAWARDVIADLGYGYRRMKND